MARYRVYHRGIVDGIFVRFTRVTESTEMADSVRTLFRTRRFVALKIYTSGVRVRTWIVLEESSVRRE